MSETQPGKHPPSPPSTTRRVSKGPVHPTPPAAQKPAAHPGAHAAPGHKEPSAVIKGAKHTTHLKTGRQAAVEKEEPRGEVEVVVSGEEVEASRVRSRVHAHASIRGLGLRQKIMIAMASVTIVTSILIFIVVYAKAVDLLSQEIDAKGAGQARLMGSIDPEFWLMAMYQTRDERERMMGDLIKAFDPDWGFEKAQRMSRELREPYESLLTGSIGESRRKAALDFFRTFVEKRKEGLPEAEKQGFDKRLNAAEKREDWQRELRALFDPFGELKPFKSGGQNLLESGEIVQLSVLDITRGERREDMMSVQVRDGEMAIDRQSNQRAFGGMKVFDGYVKGENTPVRSFQLDSPELETRAGKVKLRYYVLLGLRHIEDAKGTLRTIIFLPIFLAVLVGLAIAWWISERISEPVRVLMDDINAVSAGDLDHETVAHSQDEIGQLAATFNRMTQALKSAHDQELQQKAVEHELGIAAEIQANLVPKKMLKLPGYDISAYYRPSKEVGGDYYDFIDIDENHAGIIVADVSGKGVPGAMVMSMARAFIRMEAERSRNTSPSDTMKKANRMLAADIKKGMFVTAMYCILDKLRNELAISSAGHNPMVLWRAATDEIKLVNPKGIALGFDKGPVFERTITEERLQLEAGDRIVMYTDGTVEAMNEKSEEYGDDKFYALARQLATRDSNQFLNLVVKSLDEHKGSAPQHDDMTIVTVRYTGGA